MNTDARHTVPKIDDFIAFNRHLITLIQAGIPVELGDGTPSEAVAEQLSQINSRIALQVGLGHSVDQAISADTLVPAPYRAAWETWFHGNQPMEALNSLTSQAEARREMQTNVGNSLIQPLIVLSLVYVGFIYLILVPARQLEATYQQLGESPGVCLRLLTLAREWLPLWGVLLPLAVLLAIWVWRRKSAAWSYRWLPGRKRFVESIGRANYAENVARLLNTNHSLSESLQLVGSLESKSDLPSLLRWAFVADIEDSSRVNLLRFAARTYRDSAKREITRWRTWLPVIVGVLAGGLIVLGYGLSLFTPMVELLKTLTKP
jgi:type II secretory pathway component PulF